MSSRDDESVFRVDPLRSFRQEVFVACGMAREDAFIVADGFVQSNLRGSILMASPRIRDPYRGGDGGGAEGGREDCGVEMGDFESRATGDDLH